VRIVEIQEKVGVLLGGGGFGAVGPSIVFGPIKRTKIVVICRNVFCAQNLLKMLLRQGAFALNPTGEVYS